MKKLISFIEGTSTLTILLIVFLKWFNVVSDRFFGMMFITFFLIGGFSSLIDVIIKQHEEI